MALDGYGNYYANLPNPPAFASSGYSTSTPIGYGTGAPTATTTITFAYVDQSTGNFWVNQNATTGGWVQIGAGGSGMQVLSTGDANPNTASIVPALPANPAIWFQTPSVTVFNIWLWDVPTQKWIQYSSP
jgi:hypothetical protein